jgi:hypothetical protein
MRLAYALRIFLDLTRGEPSSSDFVCAPEKNKTKTPCIRLMEIELTYRSVPIGMLSWDAA